MAKKERLPRPGDKGYWDYMKTIGVETIKENKGGRPKLIESPEKLWEYACEYFKEVDETPYKKQDFIKAGPSAGRKVDLNNIRPYTWAGLENYLFKNRIMTKLEDYRHNNRGAYGEFSEVIARIEREMWAQKFSGATVGAFKENIIARDLRLHDDSDTNIKFDPNSELKVTITRKK